MRIKWLIVDGYNLIHRCPELFGPGSRDLAAKRRQVLQLLEKTVGLLAERITLVFDGRAEDFPARSATPAYNASRSDAGRHSVAGGPADAERTAVEVLFAPRNKTADTLIEQLVFQAGGQAGALVVTSDRAERETAEAAGAETMACSVFGDQVREALARVEQGLSARRATNHAASRFTDPFAGLDLPKPANNARKCNSGGPEIDH